MALTFLVKMREYFTQIVPQKDRFRTGDEPTEEVYSNLFASIAFKLKDFATTNLVGLVRKARRKDIVKSTDTLPTVITGVSNIYDPLVISPSQLREFTVPAGVELNWLPFRNRVTGVLFTSNNVDILDPDFIDITGQTLIADVSLSDWYSTNVISFFETNYLTPRYKITYNRTINIINPYTDITQNVLMRERRGKFHRIGSDYIATPQPEMPFQEGGADLIPLNHQHTYLSTDIAAELSIPDSVFTIGSNNLPTHTHPFDDDTVSHTETTLSYASGLSSLNVVTTIADITNSSNTGNNSTTNEAITISSTIVGGGSLQTAFSLQDPFTNLPIYVNTYCIIPIY